MLNNGISKYFWNLAWAFKSILWLKYVFPLYVEPVFEI